jgi:hypothetical protein
MNLDKHQQTVGLDRPNVFPGFQIHEAARKHEMRSWPSVEIEGLSARSLAPDTPRASMQQHVPP